MKNEEEKMHEFIRDFTDAHGTIKKVEGIDKTEKVIKITFRTAMIIGSILFIIMAIPISIMVYQRTSIMFNTMSKEKYIRKVEKMYGQKLEIVSDQSSRKGNGVIIFRTKKEPVIEFKAVKTIFDGGERYGTEYEENALRYYLEHGDEKIFQGIEIEQTTISVRVSALVTEELVRFKVFLEKENEGEIEEGVHQLVELKKFMKEKLKRFEIPLYLKIGEHISQYDYKEKKAEEEIICQEKQNYSWYLKNKEKNTNILEY